MLSLFFTAIPTRPRLCLNADRKGAFWWGSQACGRRRFFSLNMYNGTVVFPLYLILVTVEYGMMIGIMMGRFESWNRKFFEVSISATGERR